MSTHAYLDILLDLLNGCDWTCQGCGVEKKSQDGWFGDSDAERSYKLLKQFSNHHYFLDHLELGPTDFMVAGNGKKVIQDIGFKKLQDLFRTTLLTTTFLSENWKDWADILNHEMSGRRVNFFHVIDPKKAHSIDYLRSLKDKRDRFLKLLKMDVDPHPHPFLNFYDHSEDDHDSGVILKKISSNIREILGRGPYHTMSLARQQQTSPEILLKSIEKINRAFNSGVTAPKIEELNFYYGTINNLGSLHFVYRNSSWFWTPILYSPVVRLNADFQVLGDQWDFKNFEVKIIQAQSLAYTSLDSRFDCKNCEFIGHCAKNGIMLLQDHLKTKKCICPKSAMQKWNSRFENLNGESIRY
jgi:hypothetical protein